MLASCEPSDQLVADWSRDPFQSCCLATDPRARPLTERKPGRGPLPAPIAAQCPHDDRVSVFVELPLLCRQQHEVLRRAGGHVVRLHSGAVCLVLRGRDCGPRLDGHGIQLGVKRLPAWAAVSGLPCLQCDRRCRTVWRHALLDSALLDSALPAARSWRVPRERSVCWQTLVILACPVFRLLCLLFGGRCQA